ncbi:VPLPA-CTERM sorting domain-containing protein [Jannaschia sp. W003]|uniref:VPLPA-CTERM sorting domain-containing protein n=1 Tax=Jannaschia sp. W003 TaxID=2867012 RepID=UPI0021A75AE4|nr:VPLPA-CTERM sorting domain-containing protein [Jannaschia sp. W003]UWQ21174.1 VPLPA-CTERM sorting domain-containing protein [Jannaschia sp. W003]
MRRLLPVILASFALPSAAVAATTMSGSSDIVFVGAPAGGNAVGAAPARASGVAGSAKRGGASSSSVAGPVGRTASLGASGSAGAGGGRGASGGGSGGAGASGGANPVAALASSGAGTVGTIASGGAGSIGALASGGVAQSRASDPDSDGPVGGETPSDVAGAGNGSGLTAPVDLLLGGLAGGPTAATPNPAELEIGSAAPRDAGVLAPLLQQVAFVGGDAAAADPVQDVVPTPVPMQAVLGTMDDAGLFKDAGSLSASVSQASIVGFSPVPLPASAFLLLGAFGTLLVARRRRTAATA